jgi:hypothetical protein
LISQHAPEVADECLAGEQILSGFPNLGMLLSQAVLLNQESELPPCLNEIDIDGWMLVLAGPDPGPLLTLVSEDSLDCRQL